MKKSYEELRSSLTMDGLVKGIRGFFQEVPDHRASNAKYDLDDVLMSGFAMFNLKHPSLLDFEQQNHIEQENLRQVFGINELCTDAQMRNILDEVNPSKLRSFYPEQLRLLHKTGLRREYHFWKKHVLLSIDGVEHFRSGKIHCDRCLCKTHQNGEKSYSHSMLCAVLVHPDQREVFVAGMEPITNEDGQQKNDCERNAATRLLDWLSEAYQDQCFILVEDALYANGPHIRQIQSNQWQYILNVKPKSHKTLFKLFETRRQQQATHAYSLKENGVEHRFEWSNNMPLNDTHADLRVNFLHYEQTDKKGKVTKFTWITSIPLNKRNVYQMMRAARARWKIENETFNTLKNQGYHFEHNYGHGKNYLATVLAYLMLLAFLIDQIYQRCNKLFQKIWLKAKTKAKVWRGLRSIFHVYPLNSFKELYVKLAFLYQIQLE